jgi:ABC-type amino acid transport substrate-binding protein
VGLFVSGGAAAESSDAPKGIVITENQVALLRGIADFLFSTGRSGGDSKEPNIQKLSEQQEKQKEIIQEALPAKSEKILKIGVLRGNLPLADMRDGKPVGFEIDLLKLLLEKKAVIFEFLPLNAAEAENVLKVGTVDVVVGGCLKPQNGLLGCSESYLNTDIVAVFDKKLNKNSQKISFLGKNIGVIAGSSEESFMRNAAIEGAKIVTFTSNEAMLASLLNGSKNSGENIDVFLTSIHIARDIVAKYRELGLQSLGKKQEIVIQTQKDSPWLKVFNRRIKKSVGSREFSELERRWNIVGH